VIKDHIDLGRPERIQLLFGRRIPRRRGQPPTRTRVFTQEVDPSLQVSNRNTRVKLFGAKAGPHRDRASGPPAQEVVIEKPEYGLIWFKVHFGRLQLKAYTKGEHVLRLEATVHNTNELRCGRVLEKFPEIAGRLSAILDRFATSLECVDVGFIDDDQILDRLPQSSQLGKSGIGGIDLNKPRVRTARGSGPCHCAPRVHGRPVHQ